MPALPAFTAQQPLFRAYDIRGERQYFTIDFIAALGEVFANLYHFRSYYERLNKASNTNKTLTNQSQNNQAHTTEITAETIVIGFDVRLGSDTIAHMLADILRQRGLTVINLGLITTPMMAFWAQKYDGHGIMVTASHSHKDILGIKWLVANTSPSSLEIQALYQQLHNFELKKNRLYNYTNSLDISLTLDSKSNFKYKSALNPNNNDIDAAIGTAISTDLPAELIATTYIDAIVQAFNIIDQCYANEHPIDNRKINDRKIDRHYIEGNFIEEPESLAVVKPISQVKLDLTLVIDCMNGATSNIAQPLFERFCQRVIMLNDRPDGCFPIGNPDPTEPNRLAELQQTVMVNQADMGLAFDGDGDRLMIVDNRGKVINADHLLYLLAQVAVTECPVKTSPTAPEVLFDIKCSHHLPRLLSKLGATPIMTRTGSSLLRQQLQTATQPTIFAGELSGHFIFNDGYFIAYDDAMYAALRLLHWLTHTAPTLAALAKLMDADSLSYAAPLSTDVWGEPRALVAPYQLTDITKNLPVLISSADHYLPFNDANNNSCTFIEHLIEYCQYLQHVVADNTGDQLLTQTALFTQSISCKCFNPEPPILKTVTEAQQLLPAGTLLSRIDGVRLDFTHGFGVVRRSNTSNSLTVRFAGDTMDELLAVQARLVALCRLFDEDMADRIAAIQPE